MNTPQSIKNVVKNGLISELEDQLSRAKVHFPLISTMYTIK